MELLHPRCGGLDVHKKTVVACARIQTGREVVHEVATFSTTWQGLLALSDWLRGFGITHVAMESTGVYWKPVWHVLEGSFQLILANAREVRNVPGRKTDVKDSVWIADLLAHGLIRGSFVPPIPIRELRDLTRTRTQLVREIARHTLRIQKTLEDANIKLSGVLTDVLGVSGRAMLEALIAGESDPEVLASLRRGRVKASAEELVQALRGSVREHHLFLLKLHLGQIQTIETAVADVEARIGKIAEPFRDRVELLTTLPGVKETTAYAILAEIGLDMTRFPTPGHLVSWAGLCPRNDESAGKRHSTRLRKGGAWLKSALVQAAWPASRKKNSYLRSQYLGLKVRRGPKKAVVAVAASILTAAYFMLIRGVTYHELGPSFLDQKDRERTAKRLIRRLQDLGIQVEIKKEAA